MKNYFSAIAWVAISVCLLYLYYTVRNTYRHYQTKRRGEKIMRKLYEDERSFILSYLRVLLERLKNGDLNWLQVFSPVRPSEKIEIVFNHLAGDIEMQKQAIPLSKETVSVLRECGLKAYNRRGDLNCLTMPVNAKIVRDLLYYNLEDFTDKKKVKNINIKISGGLI